MQLSLLSAEALRYSGLIAYVLLFIQILLGFFLPLLTKKKKWIRNIHFGFGILVYILVAVHPLSYILVKHFSEGGFDPYSAFVNACLICKSSSELVKSLVIISFWLITMSVFAAVMREVNAWFKKNWRSIHILNYITFLIIGIHGYFIGVVFNKPPYVYFAIPMFVVVTFMFVFVKIPQFYKSFKNWVRS